MGVFIILVPIIIGLLLFVQYLVIKAAINNSELLREIKILLMKSEN